MSGSSPDKYINGSAEAALMDVAMATLQRGYIDHPKVVGLIDNAVQALINSGRGEGTPLNIEQATKAVRSTVEMWINYIKEIRKLESDEGGKLYYRSDNPIMKPFFDGKLVVIDKRTKKRYVEDQDIVDSAASLSSNLYTKEFVGALITPHRSYVSEKIKLTLKGMSK